MQDKIGGLTNSLARELEWLRKEARSVTLDREQLEAEAERVQLFRHLRDKHGVHRAGLGDEAVVSGR